MSVNEKTFALHVSEYSKFYFKASQNTLYICVFRHLHYPVDYDNSCLI